MIQPICYVIAHSTSRVIDACKDSLKNTIGILKFLMQLTATQSLPNTGTILVLFYHQMEKCQKDRAHRVVGCRTGSYGIIV